MLLACCLIPIFSFDLGFLSFCNAWAIMCYSSLILLLSYYAIKNGPVA